MLFSWNIDHYSGINWTDWNQVWFIKSFMIIDSKTQRHRISMNFQHWNVLHLAVGLNMLLISSHWKWDFPLHMCHEICLCQNVVSPLEGHLFGTWSVDLAGRGSWSFGKRSHVQHIVSTCFNSKSCWWFQTVFPFHIWDNHPNWRTHIFQRSWYTTCLWCSLARASGTQRWYAYASVCDIPIYTSYVCWFIIPMNILDS